MGLRNLFRKKQILPKGEWVKVDFTDSAKETGLNSWLGMDIIHMRGDKEVSREPYSSIELNRLKKMDKPVIIAPKIPFILEPNFMRFFGELNFYRFIEKDYRKRFKI